MDEVVFGRCKLDARTCTSEQLADCMAKIASMLQSDQEAMRQQLSRLRIAIDTYLREPGCNAQSRRDAMTKLREALEGKHS